jgi:hypothetical protein
MADVRREREAWQVVAEESIFHLLEVLICQEPDASMRNRNIEVLRTENAIVGRLFERVAEILKTRVPDRREMERLLVSERERSQDRC